MAKIPIYRKFCYALFNLGKVTLFVVQVYPGTVRNDENADIKVSIKVKYLSNSTEGMPFGRSRN